ncbi:MAG: HAD family hydrolase, partial [Lachnospiraceae bacterium]|nr:HAD family hydrolase [Lachnospiraceae bacterium]
MIFSPTATKGNAVRTLAAMLGLTPETTLCAGDSLNDLTMLSWSARPVAVANARE